MLLGKCNIGFGFGVGWDGVNKLRRNSCTFLAHFVRPILTLFNIKFNLHSDSYSIPYSIDV